ncbi:MAG: DUF7619 domain-containing protein [Bacteroidia bacterium]
MSTTVPGIPTISMTRTAVNDLSPAGFTPSGNSFCPTCLTTTANIGLFDENIYESAPVTLSGVPPTNGWEFFWGQCCLSGSLSNIANAGSTGFRIRAIMYPFNNQNMSPCFDSSPFFAAKQSSAVCSGTPVTYNPSIIDPDRDSITTNWTPLVTDSGGIATWVNGYNTSLQLPSSIQNTNNSGPNLNTQTGEISFTSYTGGYFTVSTVATSYKCGIKVAEMFRFVNIVINNNCQTINGQTNIPPILTLIDPQSGGGANFSDTVYAGDTVRFQLIATDFQVFNNGLQQTIAIESNGDQFGDGFTDPNNGCPLPPCATWSNASPTPSNPNLVGTGQSTTTHNFEWVTTNAHSRFTNGVCQGGLLEPHLFHIKAYDDYCIGPGVNSATISILVLSKGLDGFVYADFNSNCSQDYFEEGVEGVVLEINPGGYIVTTNAAGNWSLTDSLPNGSYTITIDTINSHLNFNCQTTQAFNIVNGTAIMPNFFVELDTVLCVDPEISISTSPTRRCFNNQIYVNACNGTESLATLQNSYVDVELDPLYSFNSASISYTPLGGNKFRFNLGDLQPWQCSTFSINAFLSCSATLNQTVCLNAALYPLDSCIFDTIPGPGDCTLPWDQSSLSVNGYCQNDTVYFVISNTGDPIDGDMECFSEVRIFIDGILTIIDSVQIAGGDTVVFSFAGTGQTFRLEVDQHPLHPGNSHPNDVVELCGSGSPWTPGLVNAQPLDDAEPFIDILCNQVLGAYDPNDKIGFPTGLTTNHYIYPNQQLQYRIRFQNTGNDTAFTVIIRDTLDVNLNLFTVSAGVSSHPCNFRIYGQRVLEWRFDNILLPDSNVNEPASHGFVTFTVEQIPDLPDFTTILNAAAIYFDFNAPVITNQTLHTINRNPFLTGVSEPQPLFHESFLIYPNPASESFTLMLNDQSLSKINRVEIFSMDGRMVSKPIKVQQKLSTIPIKDFVSGTFFVRVIFNDESSIIKPLIVNK